MKRNHRGQPSSIGLPLAEPFSSQRTSQGLMLERVGSSARVSRTILVTEIARAASAMPKNAGSESGEKQAGLTVSSQSV